MIHNSPPTNEQIREQLSPHREFRDIQAGLEYEAPHRGIPDPFVETEPHEGIEAVLESARFDPRGEADPDGVDRSETGFLDETSRPTEMDVEIGEMFFDELDLGGDL